MTLKSLLFETPMSFETKSSHVGLLLFRVFTGFGLIYSHGWAKVPPYPDLIAGITRMGLPAPYTMAWVAAIVETIGAIMLALGLFTRTVSFILIGHMTVVVFLAHAASTFRQREVAIFYYVAAILFYLAGPGRYSLDAMLRRR